MLELNAQDVVRAIRERLALAPTGRPAKTTTAIIEKLTRESIRLSQIQDIAGCRVVVPATTDQDRVVGQLTSMFADTSVIDRRKTSSYGYRAVHVVVRHEGRQVEVQVRTELQHQWAEISEKLADIRGHAIKYGGGDAESRALLDLMSLAVSAHEQMEMTTTALPDGQTKKEQMAQYNQRRQQLLTGLSRLKESITAGGTTR